VTADYWTPGFQRADIDSFPDQRIVPLLLPTVAKASDHFATKSFHFCIMNPRSAITPGAFLRKLPERTFVRNSEPPGSNAARCNALSRAAADGNLIRVRNGLYYKGAKSRFGMTRPSDRDVAREVLGSDGVRPAGFSAVRHLGLTTRIPAEIHLSFWGPIPKGINGVRIHKRNNARRRLLNESEIALLEVLRNLDTLVESGWSSLLAVARRGSASGGMRWAELLASIDGEGPVATRINFARLRAELVAA
jgi:hypothetical protein